MQHSNKKKRCIVCGKLLRKSSGPIGPVCLSRLIRVSAKKYNASTPIIYRNEHCNQGDILDLFE